MAARLQKSLGLLVGEHQLVHLDSSSTAEPHGVGKQQYCKDTSHRLPRFLQGFQRHVSSGPRLCRWLYKYRPPSPSSCIAHTHCHMRQVLGTVAAVLANDCAPRDRLESLKLLHMKGGNPKPGFSDSVVTYWNFDEFIEIYIHNTIQLSSCGVFQFEWI